MSEYVLRTRDISKKYGGAYAINNVSIEIKRGQIYGLIGLNGAGKTSFMRVVCGLVSPSSGELELFGQTGEKELQRGRRRIGQSIETPAIYPNLTAVQNLEIQRIISGVPDKNAITKTLEIVGLADTGNKKAKNFSLGMRQRLALAIALIPNPEFLILDEPANGLDPRGIIETRELLRRLARERGLTLLVSSHLLDELAQVATHYGIIDKGRLIKQLSADELALESRQHIRIITKDAAKAIALLKENFGVTDCQAVSANELWVREQIERTGEMNTLLVRHGIVVESIAVTEQKLEEYFLNLTGGMNT
ncbi:ABC-2 type transport system ATP-binding protein [Paenibacillus endophyticus]|uniref:ABC-2 type transport system ATP-binding protein n=1 Tax=Paenibacillus endophyticus TaxID=1294268 RepID=A0A7W5GD11_9BACL|nr:ATP-binding cassette domain-containing protein [Paenibacillus endophyticus]MBB3155425.1 ABC-2 type transport system ATP-binding protein [Paenibacillus endophyticus]